MMLKGCYIVDSFICRDSYLEAMHEIISKNPKYKFLEDRSRQLRQKTIIKFLINHSEKLPIYTDLL